MPLLQSREVRSPALQRGPSSREPRLREPGKKELLDNPDPRLWPADPARSERLRFRRMPLLVAAICFALGELLAIRHFHPIALLLLAILLLVALAAFALRHAARFSDSRRAHAIAVFPVAAIWLTIGLVAAHLTPAPDPQTALRPFADNLSRTVVGRVVRTRMLLPETSQTATADAENTWQPLEAEQTAPAAEQVDLELSRIEYLTPDVSTLIPIRGGVRVTLLPSPASPGLPDLHCGQQVEVPVRLKLPERYRDPGAWQYADYLLGQGISAHGSARAEKLQTSPESSASPGDDPVENRAALPRPSRSLAFECRILAAQAWASGRLSRFSHSAANRLLPSALRLSADDTSMLGAMLFGDRSGLSHGLRLGFERTGSFHLFVVSGMHVALVAALLLWFLRRLRVPDAAATAITLPLLLAYALLTGFGAPVQRALAMTTIFLLARLLRRDRSALNALGAAALLTLLWSPHALFEASFQMTMLAIIAIAGIAIPLGERNLFAWAVALRHLPETRRDQALSPRLAQLRVSLRLWSESLHTLINPLAARIPAAILRLSVATLELVLVGVVAELVMALPMAVYFHRATLFALPANMASVPLVGLLVPVAVLTFLCSLASPWLALLPAACAASLLHLVTFAIDHVSRIPAADARVPAPAAVVVAAAVAAWAFCCWAARRSKGWPWAAALVLPLITLAVLWPEPALRLPGQLELTAIDVGQGDSLLLVGAEGRTMLIDAGGPTGSITEAATASTHYDVGEEVVAPYLWTRRIRHLDTLVLSHAHSDHMGGMPAVLRDFHPRELWVSVPAHAEAFSALLAEARSLGTTVRFLHAGEILTWGAERILVLAPETTYRNDAAPRNDDSLVLRVDFGQSSILLEGDAEAPSERAMLAAHRISPVTLLKVGHHGSLTSSTPDFLAALHPQDALISTGLGNHFGHPRPEILGRLGAAQVRTFRTDEFGLTTFLLSRNGGISAVTGTSNEDGAP